MSIVPARLRGPRRLGRASVMVYAEETVIIEAPCEQVFAAVTDLAGMPAWRANLVSAQWNDGAPGTGTNRIRATTQLLGVRFEWECDVTGFEPPERFAYVARNGSQQVSVEFRCEPVAQGCRLAMAGSGEVPGGRIGAVAAPLYVKALLRENRKSLRTLKARLEGDQPAVPRNPRGTP